MKTALPEKCPDYYTRCPSISALSGSSKRIESALSGLHGAACCPEPRWVRDVYLRCEKEQNFEIQTKSLCKEMTNSE